MLVLRLLQAAQSACLFFLWLPHGSSAQQQSGTPFTAPAIPLAVRSPHLNCWLPSAGNRSLSSTWPEFWTGKIQGWAGYVRVDGVAFRFLGESAGGKVANQTNVAFTSTRSTFSFIAGPMTVTAEFLSPIEPDDLAKQSMPFSYLSVSASSNDGTAHHVQIYSDISAEWISSDLSSLASWQILTGSSTVVHEIALQNPIPFTEQSDASQYSTAYYGTSIVSGLTFQSGADVDNRNQFITNGFLKNTNDSQFRAISDRFPVFSFAVDLGSISSTASPVVFAIGVAPANEGAAIRYAAKAGSLQDRFLYFMSQGHVITAFQSFITDFPNASNRANALDAKIKEDSSSLSSAGYEDLTALAARQTFGSIAITVSKSASKQFNPSDVLVFMKEISSSGDINTIDVLYPAFPAFLYLSPTIGRYLLEPTLQYMESGQDSSPSVPHDLGHYPIASGTNSKSEVQPVEESGNLIIMALAVARASGDGNILSKHYNTLTGAADYLVKNALIPAQQISTDDFLGPQSNSSNLALKGIIAIQAMHAITLALNKTDTSSYGDTAKSYIQQWANLAVSQDGKTTLSSYENQSSFAMLYNLYADKLLGTQLVPANIYSLTQDYVNGRAAQYGVPFDSRQVANTKSDWMLFTAGAVSDSGTLDKLVSMVHGYASANQASIPFSDFYDVNNAKSVLFSDRPVQGAMFSLLALNQPVKTITLPDDSAGPSASGSSPNQAGEGGGGAQSGAASLSISSHRTLLIIATLLGGLLRSLC